MKDIQEVLSAKLKEYSQLAKEVNAFRYVLSQIEEPGDKKPEPTAPEVVMP